MLFQTPEPDERESDVLAQIERARAELASLLQLTTPQRWIGRLRRSQFARAIQGSNSIEGYIASLDDAAAILEGQDPLDASEETRHALEGYRDAMTYVLTMGTDPDFAYDARLLLSLHFLMTKHNPKARPGRWRPGPIYVRKEHTQEIVYEGAPAEESPALIGELCDWLNAASTTAHPPYILAAMAHLNLVMIHPFADGNGRMSRCLQSLVLARSGEADPAFMSIEEYLGEHTTDFYAVLNAVGGDRWEPTRDARPWIRFVLTAHLRQARTNLRRVRESAELWQLLEKTVEQHGLNERVIYALTAALEGRVRNQTYRQAVISQAQLHLSEQGATRDLRELTRAGLLVDHGDKRARFYLASDTLVQISQQIREPRPDQADPFA
jgi:Fic family protein